MSVSTLNSILRIRHLTLKEGECVVVARVALPCATDGVAPRVVEVKVEIIDRALVTPKWLGAICNLLTMCLQLGMMPSRILADLDPDDQSSEICHVLVAMQDELHHQFKVRAHDART